MLRMLKSLVFPNVLVSMIGIAAMCGIGPMMIQQGEMTPITLQTLVLFFLAILGGARVGAMVSLGYVCLSLWGLPVSAGYAVSKGYLHLGFYFGFIVSSIMVGSLAEIDFFRKSWTQIILWMLGHSVVLIFGLIGLSRFNPDAWSQLEYLLPGAVVKSAVGALLVQSFRKLIEIRERKLLQP